MLCKGLLSRTQDTLGSGSARAFYKGELINELLECCNLHQLRKLRIIFEDEAARRAHFKKVSVVAFRSLMADVGVRSSLIEDYVRCDKESDLISYDLLLNEAIQEKELRNLQAATNLFNEMDVSRRGCQTQTNTVNFTVNPVLV
ncbi:unnamed protein product [Effrenium voratum]|uniref:Uncharacterized protein n=1 Tax=Effrenium voratum TaxID=2562239 RepID=A0AA36J7T1_9DINO|nr:unnamed protein product [Effrenium voratum]